VSGVVLITGASSGIGRAAAIVFARAGYHVAGTARRSDRLQELMQEIASLPAPHGEFLAITGDVTSEQSMQQAVSQTVQAFGRLDILIANAGIGHRGAVADSSWQDLEQLMRTNMDGVLHSIRAAVPAMRAQGGGHILTISSVAATTITPYAATYSASKAFVSSIVNSMRIELEKDHIRISDILVGRTETEFNEKRLGIGARKASRLPSMSADTVANALLKTVQHPKNTVILRFFDWLIILGNRLIPGIIGEFAKRQYQ
jgi:short-subunit dehydrogenase